MSKILFFILGMFSGVMLPIYALQNADFENASKPEVRVIDRYLGAWKGWGDDCIHCDLPAKEAAPKKLFVESSNDIKQVSKTAVVTVSPSDNTHAIKSLAGYRSGYCECNCKTAAEK